MPDRSDKPVLPLGDPANVLAAIIEAFDDAVIGTDLEGRIVSWNQGAERIYGYTADAMVGRGLDVLIPDERAGELPWILERIRSGAAIRAHETIRIAKDGRRVDVAIAVTPAADASGLIVGATVVTRDISARLQADFALRTTEARWRAIIDAAVDGIIVIDARGRIEAFNPAAERLFGYSEGEVLGRNVNVLMPAPYHDEHDGYVARYLETGEQKIIGIGREVTGLRRDGRTFPVHLSVGEMRVGADRHFVGILHDLSGRVALEARLREQNALARLGEMAAVIAHEVKNPLTAVRGAIQVIGKRLPPDSRDVAVVSEIVARLDGLNALIQDLLLFARTPEPRLTRVEVVSLLRLTADFLRRDPLFAAIEVDLHGSTGHVSADAELLKIVFQNLLINAAQAMQGRGRIEIAVSADGATCAIRVTDQGPGIPPEARESLFRPFFTTKARGTGLGLSTARRLLELHSGTIDVTCPPEGGTRVVVRVPFAAPEAEVKSQRA